MLLNCRILLGLLSSAIFFIQDAHGQRRIWLLELGGEMSYPQKILNSQSIVSNEPAAGLSVRVFHNSKYTGYGIEFQHQAVKSEEFTKPPKFDLWDFYFHLRYYPLIPPARVGRAAAFRIYSGIGLGGYSFYWREATVYETNELRWNPFQFGAVVYAGIAITPLRSMKGITMKFNYKPQVYSCLDCSGYAIEVQRQFSVSAGIQLGPTLK